MIFIILILVLWCFSVAIETMKLNLLKPSLKVAKVLNVSNFVILEIYNRFVSIKNLIIKKNYQDKKARARKSRSKQPDPEPVILTLSSDEEDSNSSAQALVT